MSASAKADQEKASQNVGFTQKVLTALEFEDKYYKPRLSNIPFNPQRQSLGQARKSRSGHRLQMLVYWEKLMYYSYRLGQTVCRRYKRPVISNSCIEIMVDQYTLLSRGLLHSKLV